MRKISVAILASIIVLSASSCSTNEGEVVDAMQAPLLKSYELKRNANGAYSIDFNVEEKTGVHSQKNLTSLTNEVHLSKVNYDAKDFYRENLSLDNSQLKVGFFDAETGQSTKIQVEDDNIKLAKGSTPEFLKEYSLSANDDKSIQLEFEVNDNVQTEFKYNEELDIYEVHLSKGSSDEKIFSRAIEVSDTGVLKIDFVNHKYLGKGIVEELIRKPRSIIITEVDPIIL